MLRNFHKTFAIAATVAVLSTSCGYAKQYEKITKAGNNYMVAVDTLLDKAEELQIDLSSEKLLLNDRDKNQTLEDYKASKERDTQMIETIGNIKKHNQYLKSYFATLRKLATSKAPEQTKKEIESIANNLQGVGLRLQKSPLFVTNKSTGSVLGTIGKLVVSSKIDGVLKEELEKRNQVILKELELQEKMLKALGDSMNYKFNEIQKSREQLLVIDPLIKKEDIPHNLLSEWTQTRKKLFVYRRYIEELNQASSALSQFKGIYAASVKGEVNKTSLDDALRDIEYFLALLGK